MSGRMVTVGASAGGIEALGTLVAKLPSRLNASLIAAVHMPSGANSRLAELLDRRGRLPALAAKDGEQVQCGRIYVGPPDFHILVRPGRLRLLHGPREHGMRPSINALFRSAARTYGQAVIGVVLSGALDDGAAGLAEIKRAGGVTFVQDPAEALFPSMPRSALERTDVDHCLAAGAIGTVIGQLAGEATERGGAMPAVVNESREPDPLELTTDAARAEPSGTPLRLACPQCGGVLWEDPGDGDPSFRCRVGLRWPSDTRTGSAS